MPKIGSKFPLTTDLDIENVKYYRKTSGTLGMAAYGDIPIRGFPAGNSIPGFAIHFERVATNDYPFCDPVKFAEEQVDKVVRKTPHLFDVPPEEGGFGGDRELCREFYLRAIHQRVRSCDEYGGRIKPCQRKEYAEPTDMSRPPTADIKSEEDSKDKGEGVQEQSPTIGEKILKRAKQISHSTGHVQVWNKLQTPIKKVIIGLIITVIGAMIIRKLGL